MESPKQNATTSSMQIESQLFRALSDITSEMWLFFGLPDRRILHCSKAFLKLWNIPAEMASQGIQSIAQDASATFRPVNQYISCLPTFGSFIAQILNIVSGKDAGPTQGSFEISPHVVLDEFGLPIGNLAFLFLPPNVDCPAEKLHVAQPKKTALPSLTMREQQVLERLYTGATNRAISHQLHISEKTVEKHRSSAMKKLSVTTFADLIRVLTLSGFVKPTDRQSSAGTAASE